MLTTKDAVKAWAEVDAANTADDTIITDIITAFTQYVLSRSGVASFESVASYTENRDGNGNVRLFLRNTPIATVTSLAINGVAVPHSAAFGQPGYFIADDQKSIVLRSVASRFPNPKNRLSSCGFSRGVGNVLVVYTAGYAVVPPDLEMTARKVCATYYKRRSTIDLATKSISAGGTTGTTTFRSWEFSNEDSAVLDLYSRNAIIS